jgi:hypothetical protein
MIMTPGIYGEKFELAYLLHSDGRFFNRPLISSGFVAKDRYMFEVWLPPLYDSIRFARSNRMALME